MILPLLLAAAISVPADVYGNMLFLEVRVNGGPPLAFLLDTAVPKTMLDPRVLQQPAVLDLGGLTFRVDEPGALDLSFFEPLEGKRLDGILGGELFARYAVEMDYDAGLVRFHDAATYEYEGTGEIVPLTLAGGKPYVDARLKMPGKPESGRRYLVDSGSGGALVDELFPDLGRAEHVELGGFRFAGANGIPGAMKIGGELLKRFNVIADFARSRMILEPNRHFHDALLFDTSGAELEKAPEGLRVAQVYPRTPAADADLRTGDVVTRIDGRDALSLGLDRVRRMFHQVRTHELTIVRGAESRTVALALRTLIANPERVVVPTKLAGGMPVFEVRIAGKPHWFLIDTGSPYTFLDTAAAERLGIEAQRRDTVRGAGGGVVPVAIVNELTIDIAGLRSKHEVRLTDLSGLEALFGQRIDGFFGYDLLARHVVTFEPGRIVFGRHDNKGAVLPIKFGGKTNRWIYVPATIKVAGQPPVEAQFFVDSGSMDGANHPVIRKATSPLRTIGTGQGLGSAGGAGVAGRAEWVRLGPHTVRDVSSTCCAPLPGTEAQLGQDLLGRFIVTYDYARKEMTVTPVTQGRN